MPTKQELKHKSISWKGYFAEDYTFYNIKDLSYLKNKSGVYMLFTEERLVYIGCRDNLYNALYEHVSTGTTLSRHWLFNEVKYYSLIEIADYTRKKSEDVKRGLIEKFRPVLNYAMSEFSWYDELTSKKMETLLKENEMLNNKLITIGEVLVK